MATQVQFRRGTTTENNAFTGAAAELTVDTTLTTIRVHDGTTAGGVPVVNTSASQTVTNKTFGNGNTWQGNAPTLAYGGTGDSLTAVQGGMVYSTDSELAISLAGTAGQILTSGGTAAPIWVTPSGITVGTASTATTANNINGGSAGYIVYQYDTNDTRFIEPGASGTFLRSTGASTAPDWATASVTYGTTEVDLGSSSTSLEGLSLLTVTGTTTSTSTTTGAAIISGGVGIAENLNVGGDLAVTGNSTFTGTVTFNGGTLNLGDSAADNVVFGADVNSDILPNTDGTYDLGSSTQEWQDLFIDGTATIDTLQVDENATITGDLAVNGGDITTTATTFNLLETNATTVNAFGAATTIDIGATTGTMTINNNQVVFNTTDSIQIPVGTTAQRDGTPVAGQIRYNSTISSFEGYGPGNAWGSLGGVKDVDQDTYLLTEASAGSDEDTFEFYNATVNTLSLSGTAFDLKSPVTMTVNNTTDASSSTTGAVIIDGGVGIAKKLYVGSDFDVTGDAQIDGSATVSTNLTVTGDLTVNGTTTTVNTTNLVVSDSLIELSNGAASASNDAGIVVERGSTGDNAAFVWDESADSWVAATTTATGASTGALTLTNAPIIASNITASGTLAVTSTLSAATGSTIGNLTLANGSITDSSGAISFGNENLSTTGTLSAGNSSFGTITGSGALTVGSNSITAGSLDISGSVDIDGTCEADAYTVNGTTLSEYIADTAGAMFSSNTETEITVTYQDADNTVDVVHDNVTRTNTTSTATATHSGTATMIDSITTNARGHVTGVNTKTVTWPAGAVPNNATITLSAGTGLSGGGDFTTDQSSNETITFSLPQAVATTSDVQFDSFGVGTAASGTTGEIRATNAITSYYSDARLKNFTGTIENALDKVMALNGYYFTVNDRAKELGYTDEAQQVGISAQEVEAVLPEVVTDAAINNNIPEDQERDYKTVYYERMVPLLIEAIKEQQAQIDELKSKLGE